MASANTAQCEARAQTIPYREAHRAAGGPAAPTCDTESDSPAPLHAIRERIELRHPGDFNTRQNLATHKPLIRWSSQSVAQLIPFAQQA
jgi:hypothetical protein